MRIFSLLVLFSINTWALKERALFSINGKIYFTKEANYLLKAYELSRCSLKASGQENFFQKLIGPLSSNQKIEAKALSPDAVQAQQIQKIMLIGKLLTLEHEFLKTPSFKTCPVPRPYQQLVGQIYNTNLELNKRYKSFVKTRNANSSTPEELINQSSNYRVFILKDIQSRLFL